MTGDTEVCRPFAHNVRIADNTATTSLSRYNSETMALNINDMRRKAEAGNCVAQGVLGTCLLYGIEVETDYSEAFKWFSAAAEQRASRPTLHLAHMHQQGLGTAVNPQKAIKLFTAVATPSDSTDAFDARIELGRIFATGLGVPVDEAEAEKWYLAALAVAAEDDELEKIEEARSFTSRRSG
jgi:TPR repeat protein